MKSHLEATTESHIRQFSDNAANFLRLEIFLILPLSVEDACRGSVQNSYESYAVIKDDEVLAITGVSCQSLLGNIGRPWMMNSAALRRHPKDILFWTKACLDRWNGMWPVLESHIDISYADTVRWAKWAGFTIDPPVNVGRFKVPWSRIERK